jgi:hypothetical protein
MEADMSGSGSQLSEARYQLLDEATEDTIGLWEAPMTVRKVLPELSDPEQKQIARQVILSLLNEDLIEFHWRSGAAPSTHVERQRAIEELQQDRWWQVPQSSDPDLNWYEIDWLWMTVTAKGREERDRQARIRFSPGKS